MNHPPHIPDALVQRYYHDAHFHAMVEYLVQTMMQISPQDVEDVVKMALVVKTRREELSR